jgi:hypothetical protein
VLGSGWPELEACLSGARFLLVLPVAANRQGFSWEVRWFDELESLE